MKPHIVRHEDEHQEEREEDLCGVERCPAEAHAERERGAAQFNDRGFSVIATRESKWHDVQARLLHDMQASQQARLLTVDLRRVAATHRSLALRRPSFALPLRAERRRDALVRGSLRLAEPLVEDAERDDGEAGEDEGVRRADVPGAEDDAGVFDLGVPVNHGNKRKIMSGRIGWYTVVLRCRRGPTG